MRPYLVLLISFYLNYKYIGGNNLIDCILAYIFFSYTAIIDGKKELKFKNTDDFLEFIKKDLETN